MNVAAIEKNVWEKFDALNEFLNFQFVSMHEYPVDDPEYKWRAIRLCRLATELKLTLEEMDRWAEI